MSRYRKAFLTWLAALLPLFIAMSIAGFFYYP